MIGTILARPAPDTWWLDHGRRTVRLVRDEDAVIAQHRDGRSYRIPWPPGEPVPSHGAFAERVFSICEKTAAEREPGGR